jgi:glycosyltransferase involved in cell wall biosynthesis
LFGKQLASRNHFRKRRVIWIYPFPLDSVLPKRDFLEILECLERKGYSIRLVAMRTNNLFKKEKDNRIDIVTLPLGGLPLFSTLMFSFSMLIILPAYILRFKPDFVVMRPDISTINLLPLCLFQNSLSANFLLDVRSTPVETHGLRGYLQSFWFVPSMVLARDRFKGITTISPMMKTELCKKFKLSPNLVGVWPSGVSADLFDPQKWALKSKLLKEELGLSGRYIVFYHGIFTAHRGLAESIKAIKLLKPSMPSIVLFLLGTGPLNSTLKELIEANNLQQNVVIHEPVSHKDVPMYIGMSDVCIIPLPDHPYWRNQSPLKLLEYLAMEKVVIATDIPAHRLVIREKQCGVFIRSIEPSQIATSIKMVFENNSKLTEWGRIGRQIIINEYDWKKVAQELDNFFSMVQ